MKRIMIIGLAAGVATACQMDVDLDGEVGDQEENIEVGWASPSNNVENAVVRIVYSGGMCTGTLVAPDKVLTAAHCNWWNDTSLADGRWHRAPGGSATVSFGPIVAAPVTTRQAEYFTLAPGRRSDGRVDDIALLQLTEPVGEDVAIPREVLFSKPALTPSTIIAESGFGAWRDRQNMLGNRHRDWLTDGSLWQNWMAFQSFARGDGIGDRGTNIEGGDSGGPFFYQSVSGPLMGVLGWWDPSGIATYATGDGDSPNVAGWLSGHMFEDDEFGFVWAHSATGVYSITSSSYAHNPSGLPIDVAQNGTGRYRVTFRGAGRARAANAQVVAYGTDANYCKLEQTTTTADNLNFYVRCFAHWGAAVNSKFIVGYVRGHDFSGPGMGYVSTRGGAIDYEWNSARQANSVTRLGLGRYRVSMPGQTSGRSTVQVTAAGTDADQCKVRSWGVSSGVANLNIDCYDHAGGLADSDFHAIYATGRTLHGSHGGHVWASNPASASYTPSTSYAFNSSGGVNTAGFDASDNHYWVRYPGHTYRYSTPMVSSYGAGPNYCKVRNWSSSTSTGAEVAVLCFDADGRPAQTQFTQAFLRR